MKVTVKFFETLKNIVGKGEVEVDLPEKTDVEGLLKKLLEYYGADFTNYVFDDKTKKIREYLQIVIDGKCTSFSHGRTVRLKDRSVVTILPPLGGG